MAKYIKNCYEPEGTIKESLTGINFVVITTYLVERTVFIC